MVVKLGTSAAQKQYKFSRKAGKNIVNRQPVFSPDGQSLLVIVEEKVRVYNIQTAECTRTLETEKQINSLVALHFPDNDKFNLYGCSDQGLVTIWTWSNGAVLRERQLQIPDDMTIESFHLLDNDECFIVGSRPEHKFLHLASFSIKTGQISIEYRATKMYKYDILNVSIGVCDGDKYAALCNGTMVLFIQNLVQPHLRAEIVHVGKIRVINVSAHPHESAVAITDTLGRVSIVRGYLYDYHNLAKEVLHWHHLPALAACFSKEGSYLYTGGMEKVLVKWTMASLAHRAQEKQFIPRMPGVIKSITADNVHVAVSLTNNSIVIVHASMRVACTVAECGGVSARARASGPALAMLRGARALLLAGRPGHLQLYSTATHRLLCNIDITEVNNIPPSRSNLIPIELEVCCVATSADGSWLVTSEYRSDNYMYPEERLKFWMAQTRDASPFKLNTCVNLSHGGCKIVSIALNNNGTFCITAGQDQKFRIWKRNTVTEQNKTTHSWSCLTACYYSTGFSQSTAHELLNDFKNNEFNRADKVDKTSYQLNVYQGDEDVVYKVLTMNENDGLGAGGAGAGAGALGGTAVSQDGSLIAAWFGCKLTLWDSHRCALRTSLAHPVLRPTGRQVEFGNNDAAHYLVCSTDECVGVWSLLSLSLKWYVSVRIACLAADPFSNRFAVITQQNEVIVFTPHSPEYVLQRPRLLPPATGVFTRCAFAAADKDDDVCLYMMRNDSELYCLEPESSIESLAEVLTSRAPPASNFSALLAEQALSEVTPLQQVDLTHLDTDSRGKSAIAQFLSGAPHMMPPVSLLCTSFLEHISGREEVCEVNDSLLMEVDEPDSEDEIPITHVTNTKKVELWTPNYEGVKEKRLNKIVKDTTLDAALTLSMFGT